MKTVFIIKTENETITGVAEDPGAFCLSLDKDRIRIRFYKSKTDEKDCLIIEQSGAQDIEIYRPSKIGIDAKCGCCINSIPSFKKTCHTCVIVDSDYQIYNPGKYSFISKKNISNKTFYEYSS